MELQQRMPAKKMHNNQATTQLLSDNPATQAVTGDDFILSLLDDLPADDNSDQDTFESVQQAMQDTVLSLADYLKAVQIVINETFAHSVWVRAEIRSLSSKGGHYYFELADKETMGAKAGKITASCRGNLWRGQATKLLNKFRRNTGMDLAPGLNVMVKVTANFHPQYGFSVTILDIDPTYTLGDLAQQYQAMLSRLHEEGLLGLNKQLPTPFDIQHVLVIAPENAAGLGDFRADADLLARSGACYFYYEHATFQGNHAPDEIRQAIIRGMKTLAAKHIAPDILVIIRGGGAVGDLAYLNDYELAALVAEQPVPVWVGIGHERDHVILDEVAQLSFDTPSKVIAGIRQHLLTIIQAAKQAFEQIEQLALQGLQQARHDNDQRLAQIQSLTQRQLSQVQQTVSQEWLLIKHASLQHITLAKQKTAQLRELILVQHPARVLSQGYAIVRAIDAPATAKDSIANDKIANHNEQSPIISTIKQVADGQRLTIELQDGQILTQVITIKDL